MSGAMKQNSHRRPKPKYSETQEVVYGFLAIVVTVTITAHLVPAVAREYVYSVVLAAMVYLPVLRGERRGRRLREYGIHLKSWKGDCLYALMWMLIVYPFFILGNHFWQTLVMGHSLHAALPDQNPAWLFIEQTLFIALPEEFFYRGWMQTVFTRRWPAGTKIFGADFGRAIWITSALFTIGHLAAIPHPFRLAVFFPSLLFGWLRAKRGSLVSPILFHGTSNVLMAFLSASYGG